MKQIIANYYLLFFKISNSKPVSYLAAVLIVTILSIITLCGISTLLEDMLPTKAAVQIFSFPYCLISGAVLFLLYLLTLPQTKFASRSMSKAPNYTRIILTLVISIALFSYSLFLSKL